MPMANLKLKAIPGHLGDQLEIEKSLKKGGTSYEHLLKKLPDCPQRLEYARWSYKNAMADGMYFQGLYSVEFFPEDEMVACLEDIIQKSLATDGRSQWAQDALKKFPQSGKWNDRRKELWEVIIKIHLDSNIPHWAADAAKEIPRELSLDELETLIARNLEDNFSAVESAISIAGRSLGPEELKIAAKGAKKNKHWELLLKIAEMFPVNRKEEKDALVGDAYQAFLSAGDYGGIEKVCKLQGYRQVTNDELKAVFEKECLRDGTFLNGVAQYAMKLARNPANISYLEEKARALVEKNIENAFSIATKLPKTSAEKIKLLEEIGEKVLQRKWSDMIKKCAVELPEGNRVRTKLAQYLVAEIGKKISNFDSIKRGEDVEAALELVKLLPKGKEKRDYLMKLYKSASRIEEGLDRRDDLSPSGFFEVQGELNRCT